jgi:hypothetical protein
LQFTAETDKCSNNIAKYEVVLLGLRKLQSMGVQYCTLKIDSKVIVSQIEKECMARDVNLERYLGRMENYFKGLIVEYIERTKNTEADEVAKASTRKAVLPLDVFFQTIEDPSVNTLYMERIGEHQSWHNFATNMSLKTTLTCLGCSKERRHIKSSEMNYTRHQSQGHFSIF